MVLRAKSWLAPCQHEGELRKASALSSLAPRVWDLVCIFKKASKSQPTGVTFMSADGLLARSFIASVV